MSHLYSLDGKHLFKGLSILCKSPLHITVILQEMDVEPALHLKPFPEGRFGLLAQPMGPCVPTGMLGGVSNATIRRHPSFDLFHTQNSAAKRKKRVMYLQTHRLRAK